MGEHFVIFRFPDEADPGVVYLEHPNSTDAYVEEPAQVGRYGTVFDHLRATAVAPNKSIDLFNMAADTYR